MQDTPDVDALVDRLREMVQVWELHAARHREFIPCDTAVPLVVRRALDAAVCSGVAEGLREAIRVLLEGDESVGD